MTTNTLYTVCSKEHITTKFLFSDVFPISIRLSGRHPGRQTAMGIYRIVLFTSDCPQGACVLY